MSDYSLVTWKKMDKEKNTYVLGVELEEYHIDVYNTEKEVICRYLLSENKTGKLVISGLWGRPAEVKHIYNTACALLEAYNDGTLRIEECLTMYTEPVKISQKSWDI